MNPAAASGDDALHRRVAWRLVPFLFLCYVVASLDRVNLGFAKLQMLSERGWSEAVYGLGAGCFFVGYVLFDVPSSLAGHRFGARWWVTRILVTRGLIVAAMAWVESPTAFCLLRGLLGVAEAGLIPCLLLQLTRWVPVERRVRAAGMLLSALAVAGVVGGPLSGWVLQHLQGLLGASGWQWLFMLGGGLSVTLGLVTPFWLNDRIEDARWLDAGQQRRLRASLGRASSPAAEARGGLGEVMRQPLVWALAGAYFCFIFSLYGVAFWLPPLLAGLGAQDATRLGLLSAVPYALGAVAMLLASRYGDGRNRRHLVLAALIGSAGLLACGLAGASATWGLVALIVAACGCLSVLPLFWALPTSLLHGASAAAGVALINAIGNAGGFASPLAVAGLQQSGASLGMALAVLGAVQALGAAIVWRVGRSR